MLLSYTVSGGRCNGRQRFSGIVLRFIRFPGGCYVEGDRLANSFYWKKSIGPAAERPGHWNLWGYWSTDGATLACLCLRVFGHHAASGQ